MKKDLKNEKDLQDLENTNNAKKTPNLESSDNAEGMLDLENLQKLENEKVELLNDLQRTRADFENYRKQIEMQKENEKKTVKLATVMKILPLLDDMERAIDSYPELKPLAKSLEKTLKELNLEKIPSESGAEFNPDLHEAVTMDGDGEKQVIAETLRPGYFYESEILRPSMVKVISE